MMNIYIMIILFITGLLVQILGADILVKQNICFAKNKKLSKEYAAMFVGMIQAVFWSIGRVIIYNEQKTIQVMSINGSMVIMVNVLLILGICSMIYKIKISDRVVSQEFSYLIVTEIIILFLSADYLFHGKNSMRTISRSDSIILIVLFMGFLVVFIKNIYKMCIDQKNVKINAKWGCKCGLGVLLWILGSLFFSFCLIKIVRYIPIENDIRYRIIILLETAAPCMAACYFYIKERAIEFIFGHMLGFSIGASILPIGLAGLVTQITISYKEIYNMVILCFASVLLWIFAYRKNEITRYQGCIMATIFVAYLLFNICYSI